MADDAVVGGAVGAATGTVGGILGVEDRPRFREYVVRERIPSYRYEQDVRVGVILPEQGVTYYDVRAEYHVSGYRYTDVNDHPVSPALDVWWRSSTEIASDDQEAIGYSLALAVSYRSMG